jgi:hypothetical protein
MELFLIIVGCALVWLAITVAKEMHINARHRWEDRVMADYLKAEEARAYYRRLADIDRAVQVTSDEMSRIAAEANGEIIEGTCREVRPR